MDTPKMNNEREQPDLTFESLMEFINWETDRLDDASKSATDNERILWAGGKVSEETGEVWNDILSYLGLARSSKIENFKMENLAEEIADVILTVLILAKRLGINPREALQAKMQNVRDRVYKDFYSNQPASR